MAITIRPVEEADLRTLVRIELEAFKDHPRTPMMWPRGYTDDLYALNDRRKTETFHDPSSRLMKAVDDQTGQIVAFSQWTFSLDPAAEAQKEPKDPNEGPPEDWPEGGNWALRTFFMQAWEKWRQENLVGKPYIILDILVTNPEMHRRGAGSQLLSWGCEQADSKGVLMVLEATPAGLNLYKRFGFKVVRTIGADMRQFGWDKSHDDDAAKRTYMIREPQHKANA